MTAARASWLAAALACAACAHAPFIGGPAKAAAEARSPRAPGPYLTPAAGAVERARAVERTSLPRAEEVHLVGQPIQLPAGLAGAPVTWAAVPRDRERVRFADARHAVPLAPGGLTLVAEAPGYRAWYHLAVRAAAPKRPDDFVIRYYDPPDDGVAFPRPLVARDAGTWARLWTVWCREVRPPAPDVPEPCATLWVDFPRRHVVFVTVDEQGAAGEGAVVTHVDGQLVHLVVPRAWVEGAPAPAPVANPVAYAIAVPALPPGARVALAAFPEAPHRPSVTSLPEGDAGARAANEAPATVYPEGLY